jgi:integrase
MSHKPHKRSNGEGNVTRRKDGRWQASLRVGNTRKTAYAKTEKEARAALFELRQQAAKAREAQAEPGRHTLAELAEAWLSSAPGLRSTTRASYRDFLTRYAFPTLGKERLERITPDRLQRLYASLKPSVAEKLHRILHRAFAVAVLWRWLTDNPCDRALRPAYRPKERQLWSGEQAQAFLCELESHWLGPLFTILLTTGLRLGEALALRWEDVGLGVALSVRGTLHHTDGQPVINEPKTASGRRTVLLPPVAIAALKRQRAQQEDWRSAADTWADTSFVFTGKTGQPLHRCTPEAALRRLCVRLNLPAVTPHGLRHLHASLLLHEGLPVTAVSARMGHANPQITLRLYAHALPGQDAQAAEAINRALAIVPARAEMPGR